MDEHLSTFPECGSDFLALSFDLIGDIGFIAMFRVLFVTLARGVLILSEFVDKGAGEEMWRVYQTGINSRLKQQRGHKGRGLRIPSIA